MKIEVFSDLHLEFNKDLKLKVLPSTEVVLLAGDIVVGKDVQFIVDLCEQYPNKQFIFVAGNHEFYGEDITEITTFYESLAFGISNLHFLNNRSVEINDVVFHGTTLWTGFNSKGVAWKEVAMMEAGRNVSDFYRIKVRGSRMTPTIMEGLHKESVRWLKRSLMQNEGKVNVVVTHFPPILECKHPNIEPNILDAYFNNDLSEILDHNLIRVWAYGHNHWSDEFSLYDTRLVSNQLGYPREYCGFDNLQLTV